MFKISDEFQKIICNRSNGKVGEENRSMKIILTHIFIVMADRFTSYRIEKSLSYE